MATEAGEQRGSGSEPSALRAAVAMVVVGVLLVAAGIVVPDERWRAAAWILGGMTGGVGLLTLVYARVEPHLPVRRGDGRR